MSPVVWLIVLSELVISGVCVGAIYLPAFVCVVCPHHRLCVFGLRSARCSRTDTEPPALPHSGAACTPHDWDRSKRSAPRRQLTGVLGLRTAAVGASVCGFGSRALYSAGTLYARAAGDPVCRGHSAAPRGFCPCSTR